MSTRSFGMVGKTYKSTEEAFKDATYATAITRHYRDDMDSLWAFCWGLIFVGIFGYGLWLTINA